VAWTAVTALRLRRTEGEIERAGEAEENDEEHAPAALSSTLTYPPPSNKPHSRLPTEHHDAAAVRVADASQCDCSHAALLSIPRRLCGEPRSIPMSANVLTEQRVCMCGWDLQGDGVWVGSERGWDRIQQAAHNIHRHVRFARVGRAHRKSTMSSAAFASVLNRSGECGPHGRQSHRQQCRTRSSMMRAAPLYAV
jgi:hypothetical protein